MAEQPDRTRVLSLSDQIWFIYAAAAVEAIGRGHPEVDVDHMLLGLSVVGGPSAWQLAGVGADLAALRRAAARLRHDGPAAGARAPRTTLRAVSRRKASTVPRTGRLDEVLGATPGGDDDRAILALLVDGDDGRIRRLLGHLGVDVEALQGQLADGGPVAASRAGGPATWPDPWYTTPAPAGASWIHTVHSQRFPVAADRVWALISDPMRRPEWEPHCVAVSVDAGRIEQVTPPFGRIVTYTVADVVDGQAMAWRRHGHTRKRAGTGETVTVDRQLVLTPDGPGTVVSLRRDLLSRGLRGRLFRPLLRRSERVLLRVLAHAIHQAAA